MNADVAIKRLVAEPDALRRLGPYRLVRSLGSGGFAPVWLAEEEYGGTRMRTVAVKLFALDRIDRAIESASSRRKAVIEEARLLCHVEHPNIVRFYSLAIDEGRGVMGLAMEYVGGSSLEQRLQLEHHLRTPDVLIVGRAIAAALAAVHEKGLVHRDVKPANVVEARQGVPKLIDFGIAAADEPQDGPSDRSIVLFDDLPLEVIGTRMSTLSRRMPDRLDFSTGTVGYIDPECLARRVPATPESDLYALGVVLFECVTGRLPAAVEAPAGAGLLGAVLDGRRPAPPVRSVEPEVPDRLAALIDALLASERKDRPPSAEHVLRELDAIPTHADEQKRASVEPAGERASAEVVEASSTLASIPMPDPRISRRVRPAAYVGAGTAVIAIAAIAWLAGSDPPASPEPVPSSIEIAPVATATDSSPPGPTPPRTVPEPSPSSMPSAPAPSVSTSRPVGGGRLAKPPTRASASVPQAAPASSPSTPATMPTVIY